MSQLLRCKPCGYIIKEDKLGEFCPACGMPKTAFEPYKDNISPKRKFILGLDLHPIMIHFPQAFVSIIPVILLINILFPSFFGDELPATAKLLSVLLPFTVLGAVFSGIIDGKTRFKKLGTSALKNKIIAGSIFLILSVVIFIMVVLFEFKLEIKLYIIILCIACLVCAFILATIGKKLICAKLPG